MNKTSRTSKDAADKLVKGIRRKTLRHLSPYEYICKPGLQSQNNSS